MRYEIRRRPGWHGSPEDPVEESGEEIRAGVLDRAGEHIIIAGNGWRCPTYLVEIDDDGEETVVDCPPTLRCSHCGDHVPLDERRAYGVGEEVCVDALEPHTLDWCCESCWIDSLDDDC